MTASLPAVVGELVAEMREAANLRTPTLGILDQSTRMAINAWADRLSALTAEAGKGEPVAFTVVGPDGQSSIGGWMDMRVHEASRAWATLREGHRYAYAYEGTSALSTATPAGEGRPGREVWMVLECPGWPNGIDFSTKAKALDFIRKNGKDSTSLNFWLERHGRIDYTPEQTRAMLAASPRGAGEG